MKKRRNAAVAGLCILVAGGMMGAAYAAVPLYDLFCRVTGFGGTTGVAQELAGPVLDRAMTIRFDANLARGMPWTFAPLERSLDLRVGEIGDTRYRVTNPTTRPIVGTATFNVTPQKAGAYFSKIECFCFTEQSLGPGQSADLGVTFFVDPAIADDPRLDDVATITLSYTFFEVAKDKPDGVARIGTAPAP